MAVNQNLFACIWYPAAGLAIEGSLVRMGTPTKAAQKIPPLGGINIVRQSVCCLGFHLNWTPAVFIRTISNGLSLGSDKAFQNGNRILVF